MSIVVVNNVSFNESDLSKYRFAENDEIPIKIDRGELATWFSIFDPKAKYYIWIDMSGETYSFTIKQKFYHEIVSPYKTNYINFEKHLFKLVGTGYFEDQWQIDNNKYPTTIHKGGYNYSPISEISLQFLIDKNNEDEINHICRKIDEIKSRKNLDHEVIEEWSKGPGCK